MNTRVPHNDWLAIRSLQQTDFRDCQEPLLQKGSKHTLSVPSWPLAELRERFDGELALPVLVDVVGFRQRVSAAGEIDVRLRR
jgi:hypothetical protein